MTERDILTDLFGPDRVGRIEDLPIDKFSGLHDALYEAQGEVDPTDNSDAVAYEEF